MRLVSLALVVALALLVGCASFPQYKNSQLSLNELKVEKIDTAFYSVKVFGIDGNEAPAFNGVMQKEIGLVSQIYGRVLVQAVSQVYDRARILEK